DRSRKLRKSLDARHPDVEFLNQRLTFFSGRPEQFFFGLLNESEEMWVINDAGCIDVGPVSLNSSFEHQRILALRHRPYVTLQLLVPSEPGLRLTRHLPHAVRTSTVISDSPARCPAETNHNTESAGQTAQSSQSGVRASWSSLL